MKASISLIMAFFMLVSSLGATGYERYCGCTGEVFKSIFFNSKSDCCKHVSSSETKSCCKIKKTTSQVKKCSYDNKKCCDTKVKYNHYDADFQSSELETHLKSISVGTPAQNAVLKSSPCLQKTICLNDFLALCFKFTDLAPPFYLSGREILSNIQITRC